MINEHSNIKNSRTVDELEDYIDIVSTIAADFNEVLESYKYPPNKVAINQIETHKKLFLLHNKYKDSRTFEIKTHLIENLWGSQKVLAITKKLYRLISESKSIYNADKEAFDYYDYNEFYNQWIESYKNDHFRMLKSELKYYEKINKEGNPYTYANQAMKRLLSEREEQRAQYSRYKINVYTETYTWVNNLEIVLMPYFSEDFSSNEVSTQIMDEKYIRLTYDLCVGKQFEKISYEIYYSILNRSPISKMKLVVKKGENNRAYYIIYLLKNCVYELHQEEWLEYILNYFGITKNLYKSKYITVNEEDTSKKNKKFKTLIDTCFSSFDSISNK